MENTIENPASIITEPRRPIRLALAYLIGVFIIFNTLGFGGSPEWVVDISRFLLISGLALAMVLIASEPGRLSPGNGDSLWLSAGFIFLIFLGAFQALGGPLRVVHGPLFPGSASQKAAEEGVFALIFYAIFFTLSRESLRARRSLERIAPLLAVFTLGVTVFGVAQRMSGTKKIYWSFDEGASGFFGPFAYENNYGAFLALLLPLIFALAAYRILEEREKWRASPGISALMGRAANSGALLFLFVAAFTLVAAFYSRARASTVILICVAGSAAIAVSILTKNRLICGMLAGGVAVVFLIANRLNVSETAQHYLPVRLAEEFGTRITLWHDALRMFLARPLFGWGIGGFYAVASRYLTTPTEEFTHYHANSDFLEFLAETGFTGGVGAAVAMGGFLLRAVPGLLKRRSLWARATGTQALVALLSLGMMSMTDSHLRIPAIAYLFLFQLAILERAALGASHGSSERLEKRSGTGASAVRLIACGAALILGVFLLWRTAADRQVRLQAALRESSFNLRAAIARDPRNPIFRHRLAKAYFERSRYCRPFGKKRHLADAREAMEKAVGLAPTFPHYRLFLGQLYHIEGKRREGRAAIEKAFYWAPANRRIGIYLLSIYLVDRERVVSSVKKEELWRKAADLTAQLHALKSPASEVFFRTWMIRYDPDVLARLKESSQTGGGRT